MNDKPDPTPAEEQRRAILKDFLSKKTHEVHIDEAAPSLILQANADGSLKPTPPPAGDQIQFRAYPDGTFCKFTEVANKPGFLAICLNTSNAGERDVLHQVGIVKSRAVADLLCDGVTCMMQLKVAERQARAEVHEEANELACDAIEMPAAEHITEAHNPR